MIFEIKKLFSPWLTLICLGLTLVFLSVFIVNAYRSKDTSADAYEKLLSDLSLNEMSGQEICDTLYNKKRELEIQVDEAGDLAFQQKGEYSETLMGDSLLFSRAYDAANYLYVQIPSDRRRIVNDSLYNISEESQKVQPDKKNIQINDHIIDKYNRVIKLELKSTGSTDSMQLFFDNTIWDYIMIAFAVMIAVRMFTIDITCGAYQMIYSSFNGRKKLFIRQFFAAILVVSLVIIFHSFCQLVCGIFFFGVKDFSLPLQMDPEYELCPYLITIGGYLGIKLLAKLLFYTMITSISILITILCRKVIVPFVSSLIIGVAPLITITHFFLYSLERNSNNFQFEYQVYNIMRTLLPHSLLNLRVYFQGYDEINLFGFPFCRLLSVCFVTTFIIIICFVFALNQFGAAKKR